MPRYSPFEKELKDIGPDDLEALMSASEGWYVEYKREVPNASSMAKSAAAFANTYGGWIFYGVVEKSKEDAVAGSFPGIPRSEVDAALQRFRQALATMVNPTPHFDSRVIWGPSSTVDLDPDHAVICIYVPWGPNAPYVHKGGHIYRRVSDGSEPKPENDRFVLDQLWQRSDETIKDFARWIDEGPDLSEEQAKHPYLRLLLVADLWDDRSPWLEADVTRVRKIMRGTDEDHTTMPYDTVYSSAKGFVARQTRNNDPNSMTLTWRLNRDLTAEILFPLSWRRIDNLAELYEHLEGYDHVDAFVALLRSRDFKRANVIDLNVVYRVLIGIAEMQNRILDAAGWPHSFHIKAIITNAERTIPFLDLSDVLAECKEHGVPMLLDRVAVTPSGRHPETFREIGRFVDTPNEEARAALQAISMFKPIADAYGLASWWDPDDENSDWWLQLNQASQRALDRQPANRKKAGLARLT